MSHSLKKYLVIISGPTAVGKTNVGIDLAAHFRAEIISADSRQFYREMNIGTAKPDKDQLNKVKHHFVNNLSIENDYSAGQFEEEVLEFLKTYFESHEVAIMTGGSGMFIDAVCHGLDETPRDLKIREELNVKFTNEGLSALLMELKKVDPVHFKRVDQKNPQRIIRALEVYRCSGRPLSSFHSQKKKERYFSIIHIGLDMEREKLYQRINERVDEMIRDGWLEEAKTLFPFKNLNALNTVGYKEIFQYLSNELTWQECIEEIKKNTRNYAKRQFTWLKRNPDIHWFKTENLKDIRSYISNYMTSIEEVDSTSL